MLSNQIGILKVANDDIGVEAFECEGGKLIGLQYCTLVVGIVADLQFFEGLGQHKVGAHDFI